MYRVGKIRGAKKRSISRVASDIPRRQRNTRIFMCFAAAQIVSFSGPFSLSRPKKLLASLGFREPAGEFFFHLAGQLDAKLNAGVEAKWIALGPIEQ